MPVISEMSIQALALFLTRYPEEENNAALCLPLYDDYFPSVGRHR